MRGFTRRDMLKGGVAGPAVAALGKPAAPNAAQPGQPQNKDAQTSMRERLLLDFGWRFHFGHADDPTKDFDFGAGRAGGFQKTGNFLSPSHMSFDDSSWTALDLPHDWVIRLPFKNDPAVASKGFYPVGRGYPESSVGWYRRVFEIPASDTGKRVAIEFDGVYRDAMIVLNGFYVGKHSGGYDPFSFDLTDFIIPGSPNVLLVRVDASLSDGWFYEGGGIYRHIWLVKTAPVHVKRWGTFVRARVQQGAATISIRTEVNNHSDRAQNIRVISSILDASGKEVAKSITSQLSVADWADRTYEQQIALRRPTPWSLEEPHLYKLVPEVEAAGSVTDRYETRFGVRSLRFDPETGFYLNGKPVKVRGTCNHQDHAGVGVAVPDALQYFRVRKLQEMGCNAYRSSHNPPAPELLDACDELGMLFLDETRMMSSNPEGLAQFENLVRRDRNHPSVFMWSMGNEERESTTEFGLHILTAMKRVATEHDGSRPVTVAPPPLGMGLGKGGLTVSDVMGYNYADPPAEAYHKQNPKIPMMGTENVSAVGTRGVYVTEKGFVGSYDPYTTTGRASAEGWWRFVNSRPWVAGGFIWTGFDYRGEPSPYQWPNISSQYGVIDTCGFPKDTFFYYQSWWTEKPVLHVFPHWNWPGMEGKEIAVWVHSNLDKVELLHNGQSLGAKDIPRDSHVAWNVTYTPGSIEARGYKNGAQVLTAKRETTGPAALLVVRPDREQVDADGQDTAVFAVEVHDAQGRLVPVTENDIGFRVSGPGAVIGTGNGDPTNHESDVGSTRKAFSGMCMAIVQSSKSAGTIAVEASSPGLRPATARIEAKAVDLRRQVPVWERPIPSGPGITGLWRPSVAARIGTGGNPMALTGGGVDMVFTLREDGSMLTGSLETSAVAGFGGGSSGGPIEDGRIDGSSISFRVGTTTYTGSVQGDQIELRRSAPSGRGGRGDQAKAPSGSRPAIGPPPDGSDPSLGPGGPGGGRGAQSPSAFTLRRAKR